MHALLFERAAEKSRGRSRTLIAKDGTVWMWPGVPLTVNLDGQTLPLPGDCVWFWITRLHGFEADPVSVDRALSRAAKSLTLGDQDWAQAELDRSGLNRLSPEGGALMGTTAKRLGVPPVRIPVGYRSVPWGSGEIHKEFDLFDSFAPAAVALEKAWNEDDHPRWPEKAPNSQGGRFTTANSGADASEPADSTPGIGHNGGPPLEDMPDIPDLMPSSAQVRNAVIRNVASWLLRRGVVALIPGVGEAAMIVQAGIWLYQALPYLDAYVQQPQSLQQLQDAVNDPQPGYDVHHIVEQTSARQSGFSDAEINSPENTVRISTLKHWQISAWYSKRNADFGGLSPRDYLRDKDWSERMRVGREALIDAGVLKP